MKIDTLQLVNFRNYDQASLRFPRMVNVFYGKNGQGKTNLLEAIYYAAFGLSHRSNREEDLVRFGQDGLAVLASLEREDGPHRIRCKRCVENGRWRKEVRIDDKKTAARDHYGFLNVVMFSPEDLQIVKGEPALRRRFLDMEIAQTDPLYYDLLVQYNRSLKQRNRLLKDIREEKASRAQLDPWDEALAGTAAKLLEKRLANLARLQSIADPIFRTLSEDQETLRLVYDLKANDGEILHPTADDGRDWRAFYGESLAARRFKDILQGTTGIGIHRDDLDPLLNGRPAKAFASQGQQRCCALALKMSQIEYVRDRAGEYPVLLLDDVMSELDSSRRRQLVSFITDKVQTFLTVNDKSLIPAFPSNAYFEVTGGCVRPLETGPEEGLREDGGGGTA